MFPFRRALPLPVLPRRPQRGLRLAAQRENPLEQYQYLATALAPRLDYPPHSPGWAAGEPL